MIADPASIGWAMVGAFALVLLVDQAVGIGGQGNHGSTGWNVLSVIATSALTFTLLWLAKLTYLRRSFACRHVAVMVVTMFLCVLAGTVIASALITSLSGPSDAEASPIGLDRMLFGTILLVSLSRGIGLLRAYRTAFTDLQAVQQQLTVAAAASENALRAERDHVIAPIVAVLRRLRDSLPHLSAEDAAVRMREVAANIVRPVSHTLIATTTPVALPKPASVPRPSWRITLSQVAASPLLLPKVMAVTMVFFVSRLSITEASSTPAMPRSAELAVTVDLTSLVRALGQLVVVFMAVWLSAAIASRALRQILPTRTPAMRWLLVLGSIPIVALIAQAIVLTTFGIPGLSPDTRTILRNPLIFLLPLLVISAVAGVIRTARTRGTDMLRQLGGVNRDLAFEVARLNEELWMQRRSLSKTLHGPVQATLNSAALLLSHSHVERADGMPQEEMASRLTRAIMTLEDAVPEQIDVVHELALIRVTWQDIINVQLNASPDTLERIERDPLCAASFVDIVGEATANAVIHGGATRIVFDVVEQGQRNVRIDAVDDGTGVSERDGGGLGSQLLRETCTEWGLSSEGGATRLFAVVPISSLAG